MYPIIVDYEKPLENLFKRGRYLFPEDDITSKNFPQKKKGKVEVCVELISFEKQLSKTGVTKELNRRGYRPADIWELLTLGAKYRKVSSAIALGSIIDGSRFRNKVPGKWYPKFFSNGSERCIGLFPLFLEWRSGIPFAAVRKN